MPIIAMGHCEWIIPSSSTSSIRSNVSMPCRVCPVTRRSKLAQRGNDTQSHAVPCKHMQRHQTEHNGTQWHTLAHNGVQSHAMPPDGAQLHNITQWCKVTCNRIKSSACHSAGMCRRVSSHSILSWCTMGHNRGQWCVIVYVCDSTRTVCGYASLSIIMCHCA